MKFLLVGDIHGNWNSLFAFIEHARTRFEFDAIIQVGDFGAYNGIMKPFLKTWRDKYDIPLYFIDGNHEDHPYIAKAYMNWKDSNVHYCPRGTILKFGDAKIGFLGGALNVDRPQEMFANGIQNFPSAENVMEFLNSLHDMNEPLDLMVTHSCPHSIGVGQQGKLFFVDSIERYITNAVGLYTGPINDCGEPYLKDLWTRMIFKPKNWIYGHFHSFHQSRVQDTDFICLGTPDNDPGNPKQATFFLGYFDTEHKIIVR